MYNVPHNLHKQSENIKTVNKLFRLNLTAMNPKKDQTYVVWGRGFPYEIILPLEDKRYLDNFNVLGIGVFNQSPIQQKKLRTMGIQDPFHALVNNENYYIALRPLNKPLLRTYLEEHYGVNSSFKASYASNFFQFYSVTSN
jgi:hypothetical protein